ncbi:MAG: Rpp14/Pop5 family protein [Desulfurococcaceae archaeon]
MYYEVALVILVISMLIAVVNIVLLRRALRLYKAVLRILEPKRVLEKRPRKRYVVFSAICEDKVSFEALDTAIKKSFNELYGKAAAHKASPKLVIFDEARQRGIIRVSHAYKDHLVASLGLIKEVNGVKCIIAPLKTTGTIKKARAYLDKLKF